MIVKMHIIVHHLLPENVNNIMWFELEKFEIEPTRLENGLL